jgi:hypothetical protein
MKKDEAVRVLAMAVAEMSAVAQEAAAAAIRSRPSPLFEETLIQLAANTDLRVRVRVAEAMSRMPSVRFLPVLRSMLVESALRPAAFEALVSVGRSALDFLAASLDDETLPREIRLRLPRCISLFDPSEAVPVLWRRLTREVDDLIQFKILFVVGRLVAEKPEARPSRHAVTEAIHSVSRLGLQFAKWRAALAGERQPHGRDETKVVLVQLLTEKRDRAVDAIIRLLGLVMPDEDFERISRGVRGGRTERASSIELLENVVHGPARAGLRALLDDTAAAARGGNVAHLLDPAQSYEAVLATIVREGTGVLRTVAARHAAEIGLAPAA